MWTIAGGIIIAWIILSAIGGLIGGIWQSMRGIWWD